MIRVALGSENPVKISAVKEALETLKLDYELVAVKVESGVSSQPFCEETLIGAKNRAMNALIKTNLDIGIGIEGGVCNIYNNFVAFAIVYMITKNGLENFAISASFTLPKSIVSLLFDGKELGEATDLIFNVKESKKKEGAVGLLTKVIDRKELYVQPVIMALYPLYNVSVMEG
ncbi:purine NTP phosphatase [Sulfolobus sp. A20]|uniref:inosine/xanthosine triphosphatase n=1 Tax=Sulfolobaceae TaxID=118883 RepID=UPI000845ECC8|nr:MULTISPECIES: inosine/xanthosine triphosphatase [unclassified Sulfolobus]TRM77503.1 inosine/xanthosine triphosphatase [Sulfolobus sp. A20-N-F8]TRM82926.1 inosine/xanthosine triphosphatase [Sulfolobus sp. A20-N-F6]TRM89434.1 inosine/xanthosine triphosphatase [Sulfolobus sp. C3]TRN00262.1 inosine/xanthosine triphosphatase [Sulfolobus sp. F1]TRN04146.1 inosine/xanthosine triphosphatase [Sulfolobus sp. E1]